MKSFISISLFLLLAVLLNCNKKKLFEPSQESLVPKFSLEAGQYDSARHCTLTVETEEAIILYTLDGTEPAETSERYIEPILIDKNLTLKARTYFDGDWSSDVVFREYELVVKPPTASLPAGIYSTIQNVTLDYETPGSVVRYTLGNEAVLESSPEYSGPIAITSDTTLFVKAFKPGWTPSQTVSFEYDLNEPDPPVFTPPAGTYPSPLDVTIRPAGPQATIRYTLDGQEPTENTGNTYTAPITINTSVTIRARAYSSDALPSPVAAVHYEIEITNPNAAPQPLINPAGGTFNGTQKITLSSDLPGGQIRYTTDNSEPNENSALYTDTLTVAHSQYIKAKTFHPNFKKPSATTMGLFSISTPAPLFSSAGGNYTAPVKVALTVPGQPQAKIWYTLDGSEPGPGSPVYTDSIPVNKTSIIKARAFSFQQHFSSVAQAAYNFSVPVMSLSVKDLTITSMTSTYTPDISWTPPNATDKSYTLSFSSPGIVSQNAGKIRPLQKGQVIGKVISNDGKKEAQFIISVAPKKSSLTLITPNGGEKWQAGRRYYIEWTSEGVVGDVKLEYNTGNGWNTITSYTSDHGRYSWDVPNVPSKTVRVRIRDANNIIEDVSESPFEIIAQPVAPSFKAAWVKSAGGPASDYVMDAALDPSGNTYITGKCQLPASFDQITLNGEGEGNNAFVGKYSPNGALLWVKSITGSNTIEGQSVAVSALGDAFVLGKYCGEFLADEKQYSQPVDTCGLFLAKYNPTGALSWVKLLEKAQAYVSSLRSKTMATDASGNAVVTGYFEKEMKLGDTVITSEDDKNMFIAKYDGKTGDLIWVVKEGSGSGHGIALAADESIFIIGRFSSSISLGFHTLISSGYSIFVAKFNSRGKNLWASGIKNSYRQYCFKPVADSDGGVTIGGTLRGSSSFGTLTLRSSGSADVFIARYTSSGSLDWAVGLGGRYREEPFCMTGDQAGNIYIAGRYTGGLFDMENARTSRGSFVVKCDNRGTLRWVMPMEAVTPYTLIVDDYGSLRIAGSGSSITEFISTPVPTFGSSDIFLAKVDILHTIILND